MRNFIYTIQHSFFAVQCKRHGLRTALFILLLLWVTGSSSLYASGKAKQESAAPTKAAATANPADFVGSETCTTCHEDVVKKFAGNPHTKLALAHNGTGATCEGCHGPGKAHVDGGGDVTKIFRFTKASAQDIDEKCLGCHQGKHANFERSAHGTAKVSCIDCHSIHSSEMGKPQLLKLDQPKLCYTCHTDVKPQFSQAFHHKVDEGLLNCSDCHDPHGTFQKKNLKSTADQNAVCTKCHTETAGPFVYEHPVIKTEGCSTCHSPHGSPNPRLLNVSNVNMLCLQCHSATNTTAFPRAVSPTGPVHSQAAQYVACTNCHAQIHGSNASSVFFK
jgi:DmsE family decaheme c-type cytochrome